MAINAPAQETPLAGLDDLLAPFHDSCKPRSQFRVGTEAEKFGVFAESGEPVPFSGERSVQQVLSRLVERYNWQPEHETEGGVTIALRRDDASITLEPAGQLELSGAPHASLHSTCKEFRQHVSEVKAVCEDLKLRWLSLGFHPFATQAELPHVPKLRYGVMERYLPTRAKRSLDMMRRTCTVQANHDYESEADAMRKLRVALALQPIATALFANSPFYEGKRGTRLDERADVWLNMDPDRSGMLPFAWEHTASFRSYIDWALDAPMFMIKRESRMFEATHLTFRTFLRDGLEGQHATMTDWKTHINTLFPEVRLKNTLEMRGVDAQSTDLICALPALWKGVVDDPTSLAQAEQLVAALDYETVTSARLEISIKALDATLAGRPVKQWANELLEIARGGLARFAIKDQDGRDETIHLERIIALTRAGKTPASELLSKVDDKADKSGFRQQVIAATQI